MSTRKLVQHSRSDVAWALVAFVALDVLLVVAVQRWFPEMRDPHYAYKAERLARRLARTPGRPCTVLMLGTSRTAYGLNGKVLEKQYGAAAGRPLVVFNFGIAGGGPISELLTLRRLLATGIRPDYLLVEVIP